MRVQNSGFCDAHRISRAHYYNLKRRGLGPDETDVVGVIIITAHNAARWRRQRERSSRAPRAERKAETGRCPVVS